jgi:hypothetical protein
MIREVQISVGQVSTFEHTRLVLKSGGGYIYMIYSYLAGTGIGCFFELSYLRYRVFMIYLFNYFLSRANNQVLIFWGPTYYSFACLSNTVYPQ